MTGKQEVTGLGKSSRRFATDQFFACARAFFGRSKTRVADRNNGTAAMAKPAYRFPVFKAIAPIMGGPTNWLRFATELIKAMPAAAENPVRNSQGNAQKGPKKLRAPTARKLKRATE